MDFLEGILKEKGSDLIAELTGKAGYSTEQAEKFLPEAGSSVAAVLAERASDLDLGNMASAANVSAILKGVDIGGLARRSGVSAEQGAQGLTALLPMLMGFIGDRGAAAGGLLSLLGGGAGLGDAMGSLKGLGGKLFR